MAWTERITATWRQDPISIILLLVTNNLSVVFILTSYTYSFVFSRHTARGTPCAARTFPRMVARRFSYASTSAKFDAIKLCSQNDNSGREGYQLGNFSHPNRPFLTFFCHALDTWRELHSPQRIDANRVAFDQAGAATPVQRTDS